jgi:hypothetical protein
MFQIGAPAPQTEKAPERAAQGAFSFAQALMDEGKKAARAVWNERFVILNRGMEGYKPFYEESQMGIKGPWAWNNDDLLALDWYEYK